MHSRKQKNSITLHAEANNTNIKQKWPTWHI